MKKYSLERYECPNNNLFVLALMLFILFLLIELGNRVYDLYRTAPFVDILSHFFAGMAIFTGIYWIISLTRTRKKTVAAIFFTFVVAVFWEILETLEELVIENPPYLRDVFVWDGVGDIVVTVIGGFTAVGLLSFIKQRTRILEGIEVR